MGVRSSSADEVNPFRNGLAPNVEILAEHKRRGSFPWDLDSLRAAVGSGPITIVGWINVDDRRVADLTLPWLLPDPSRSCGGPDPLFICRVGSASDLWTGGNS
jgi:hypothetical protein